MKDDAKPTVLNATEMASTTTKATKSPTETTAKDEKKVEEKKEDPKQTSTPTSKSGSSPDPERSADAKGSTEALNKAEHMEEQAAQLQEKLYSQGAPHDAYKSIEPQKPMFTENEQETPEDQQTLNEQTHHHHHRRHHHTAYDDEQEEAEQEQPESRQDDDDDDDEDDGEEESDNNSDDDYDDNDAEDDDEGDGKRKKSYLHHHKPLARPQSYRNYQRDLVASHQAAMIPPPEMMNRGLMNDEGDKGREELEDSKKSIVPTARRKRRRTQAQDKASKWNSKSGLMYTL